ncbi:MAG: PAS domain-containing protein [Lentisphaerae bacterium]|nr:PAS domain-containing protein [Lentisphaerota bacterium]MCP4101394.1 PAS domain-containing protein [Lentisphaerota bacterium]
MQTHVFYGAKSKAIRKAKKITIKNIADALGKSEKTIWTWETGRSVPKKFDIECMAKVLKISPLEISDISLKNASNSSYQEIIFHGIKHISELRKQLKNENINFDYGLFDNLENYCRELEKTNIHLERDINKLKRITDVIDSYFFVINSSNHSIFEINKSFLKFLHLHESEAIGKTLYQLNFNFDIKPIINLEKKCLELGCEVKNETIKLPSNRFGLATATPIYDSSNFKIIQVIITIKDITIEHKHKTNLFNLENAICNSDIVVWSGQYTLHNKLVISYVSENIHKICYVTKQEVFNDGFNILNSIHPEDYLRVKEWLQSGLKKLKRNTEKISIDFKIIDNDQKIKWLTMNIEKSLNTFFGYLRDITARRLDELERIELQQAIDNSDDLVIVERPANDRNHLKYNYTYIGNKVKDLWGINKTSLKQNCVKWYDVIVDEDRQRVIDSLVSDSLTYIEYRMLNNGNEIKWLSHKIIRTEHAVFSYITDITDKKAKEDRHRILEQSIEHSPFGEWLEEISPDGKRKMIFFNKAMEENWGRPRHQLLNNVKWGWLKFLTPESRIKRLSDKRITSRLTPYSFKVMHPNKKVIQLTELSFVYKTDRNTIIRCGRQWSMENLKSYE